MKRIVLMGVAVMMLSGCGSMFGRHDGAYSGGAFPATRFDWRYMTSSGGFPPIYALDLPFSIITDIIMLPSDADWI